jgi:lipoprotein signal peptidase
MTRVDGLSGRHGAKREVNHPAFIAQPRSSEAAAVALPGADSREKLRQRLLVAALVTAVIVLDQATKWWAWRHVAGAEINTGGDFLVGRTIGRWYADPLTGALLDLLDSGLLTMALLVLVRHRGPTAVAVPGALMLGGWGSNLLDRLGTHYWTAPGSARGAVDFIHIAWVHANLADLVILGATPLFLLAAGYGSMRRRTANRPTAVKAVTPAARRRPSTRVPLVALASVGLILVAVAFGAASRSGLHSAPTHTSANSDRHARSILAASPLRAA